MFPNIFSDLCREYNRHHTALALHKTSKCCADGEKGWKHGIFPVHRGEMEIKGEN